MYDHTPLRTVCVLLLPATLALAAFWLLCVPAAQDAVFAALKLVVTR